MGKTSVSRGLRQPPITASQLTTSTTSSANYRGANGSTPKRRLRAKNIKWKGEKFGNTKQILDNSWSDDDYVDSVSEDSRKNCTKIMVVERATPSDGKIADSTQFSPSPCVRPPAVVPEELLGYWCHFESGAELRSTNFIDPMLLMALSTEILLFTDTLVAFNNQYEILQPSVRNAIHQHISNFSSDVASHVIQIPAEGLSDDQLGCIAVLQHHTQSWKERDFGTFMALLSRYREILDWLLVLTPELAFAKIQSALLGKLFPEVPPYRPQFRGIPELCCRYLLELCQSRDDSDQQLALSYLEDLSKWAHSQILLENEGVREELKRLRNRGTFDQSPWALIVVEGIVEIDRPFVTEIDDGHGSNRTRSRSPTSVSPQASIVPHNIRRGYNHFSGQNNVLAVVSKGARAVVGVLSPYRLLFILCTITFGVWKIYSDSEIAETLNWFTGIILCIFFFILGECKGSAILPCFFQSFGERYEMRVQAE